MSRLSGNERAIAVNALRRAAPYIRMFKRKVFVLKAGGDAFATPEGTRAIMEQVGILQGVGISLGAQPSRTTRPSGRRRRPIQITGKS